MNGGYLLTCPNCLVDGHKQTLGSVDDTGALHVRRHRLNGGTTIIQSGNYTIMCSCGFGTAIVSKANGYTSITLPQP